jgi:hypothetical protein
LRKPSIRKSRTVSGDCTAMVVPFVWRQVGIQWAVGGVVPLPGD